MSSDSSPRLRTILTLALLAIVVFGITDLMLDRVTSWLAPHPLFEFAMIVGALALVTALWLGWWRSERAAGTLRESLEAHRAERDAWRASAQSALEGLGRAIDAQFGAWRLTPTEREIALLLLKGYGHKQIAAMTGRSERTVRQHGGAIYEKAGLGGRAELAAFFLQDLMLPEPQRAAFPSPMADDALGAGVADR